MPTGRLSMCWRRVGGFTLIELLVVIAVIAMLLAILLPSLNKSRQRAVAVVCASHLRSVGTALYTYAQDYNGSIPYGPEGRPVTGSNFYTVTGNVTSLLSLEDGAPVGLGLLLDGYVSDQPKVLFCPGADQPSEAEQQLSRVGRRQAQSDYYYRHGSETSIGGQPSNSQIRLGSLGRNRNGRPIRALVMDVQFVVHPSLAAFGVITRTSHRRQIVNMLYADGQVVSLNNHDDRFTVRVDGHPQGALNTILNVFEQAD